MSFDVIPNHLSGFSYNDGGAYSTNQLLIGEIQALYYPNDPKNQSKKCIEYDVFVGQRLNGTANTKIFNHVGAMDKFGGQADSFAHTFRYDTSAKRKGLNPGVGSKVLLLCINGSPHDAIIIGGIRDNKLLPEESTTLGNHHLRFCFNGVEFTINDSGELSLQIHGKTNADGSTVNDDVGTSITITKDGNVNVKTKDNNILVDQAAGTVNINSKNNTIITSPKIQLGSSGASEPGVKGNSWRQMMSRFLDAVQKLTVYTPDGPSSQPINSPEFKAIQAQLQDQLSDKVFLE